MLQLHPPIPVETEHGPGVALLVIDYGTEHNSAFVVALQKTRELKHYQSSQLRLAQNFTFGFV